jgi:tRNA pseudouridine55 synthase
MTDGFLLVDKPGGRTSHDVVLRVRHLLRRSKVGHAGTLDPMATGLLVLGIGRATRLLRFVQDGEKAYVARAVLGVATASLDADGAVLDRSPMPVARDDFERAAGRFVGRIMQIPPMVSAVKVGGRRLYEMARKGEEVEREARAVLVHEIRVLDFAPSDYPEVEFLVRCGSGTYVRTLADDIARALGGRAHLTALRRTRIGRLEVADAVSPPVLEAARMDRSLERRILPPARGLGHLPSITVGPETEHGVRHGTPFPNGLPDAPEGPVCVLDAAGDLLAVYRVTGGSARAEVVLS